MNKPTMYTRMLFIVILMSCVFLPTTGQAQTVRADFTVNGETGTTFIINNGSASFDASASYPDDVIYRWRFDRVTFETTSPRAYYAFEQEPDVSRGYNVTLTIQSNGVTDSKTVYIEVPCSNHTDIGGPICGIGIPDDLQ